MKVKSIVQAGALCFKNSSLIKVFFLLWHCLGNESGTRTRFNSLGTELTPSFFPAFSSFLCEKKITLHQDSDSSLNGLSIFVCLNVFVIAVGQCYRCEGDIRKWDPALWV
jgi:hypothetical protein